MTDGLLGHFNQRFNLVDWILVVFFYQTEHGELK